MNNDNLLELHANEAIILILTYGQINLLNLTPQGRQSTKVVLKKETITELLPNIADAILFGGTHSYTHRDTFAIIDGDTERRYIKKRNVDDNDYSFSRCSGTSSAKFLSSSFRDTMPSPASPNLCADVINVLLVDSFDALSKYYTSTNDCNKEHENELIQTAQQHLGSTSEQANIASQQHCQQLGEDLSKKMGETDLIIDKKLTQKHKLIDPWNPQNPEDDISIKVS